MVSHHAQRRAIIERLLGTLVAKPGGYRVGSAKKVERGAERFDRQNDIGQVHGAEQHGPFFLRQADGLGDARESAANLFLVVADRHAPRFNHGDGRLFRMRQISRGQANPRMLVRTDDRPGEK